MKRRTGLISNSSSSSFCIVGVHRNYNSSEKNYLVDQICDAAGWDYNTHYISYGEWYKGKPDSFEEIQFLGYDSEICYIGLDFEERFRAGKTLDDIRKEFIDAIQELTNIQVNPYDVDFYYGEIGNG